MLVNSSATAGNLVFNNSFKDGRGCFMTFKPVYHVTAAIIAFLVMSLNSFVLALFFKYKYLRKPFANYILVSLAVNDMLSGASILMHILPYYYLKFNDCKSLYATFKTSYFVAGDIVTIFLAITAVSHLVLLSTERCISLFYALRYSILITKLRIFIVIAIAWVLGLLVTILQLAWVQPYLQNRTRENYKHLIFYEKIHIKTVLICFAFIPAFILTIQYTWLFSLVRRLVNTSVGVSVSKKTLQERRALMIYCVMFVCFLIFCVPYLAVKLIISFNESLSRSISGEVLEGIFLLRFIISIINPLVYALYKKDFRRAAKSTRQYCLGRKSSADSFYTNSFMESKIHDQTRLSRRLSIEFRGSRHSSTLSTLLVRNEIARV